MLSTNSGSSSTVSDDGPGRPRLLDGHPESGEITAGHAHGHLEAPVVAEAPAETDDRSADSQSS